MSIRNAAPQDVEEIIRIEAVCFPPAEAAQPDDVRARYAAFPENFFVYEQDGSIAGFINGCTTDAPELPDALYHDASLHRPDGAYQTVFGLDVLPEYRKNGIGGQLIRHYVATARARGKKGVVLTCKDHMIRFYERAGFTCKGVSASSHGGAKWNDMLIEF